MEALTSVDALRERVRALIPGATRWLVGMDGMNEVGKTTLAHELAKQLGGVLISLDEYLVRKQNAYTEHIRCHDVLAAIESVAVPIVIEGVCLRAVAERCGLAIDVHIYVRRINKYGRWNDEDICLAERPPDALKERERQIRSNLPSNRNVETTDLKAGLREELIDYHARWNPTKCADILFDVVA